MPIRPENRKRYPKNWKSIVAEVRKRSKGRCEFRVDNKFFFCAGPFKNPKFRTLRCKAINGEPHPITGSKVVLTVAHLNHTPENCGMDNIRDACQRCHNTYDAPMRRLGIKQRAMEKCAIGDLLKSEDK